MRRKSIAGFFFAIVVSISLGALQAQEAPLKLAGVFGDHMVLQRDQPIPIWGWASAGNEVTVALGDIKAKTKADDQGKWMVKLNSLPAGGPHELVIQGNQKVTVSDVMVGEVWLCSGQSNMAWKVSQSQDFEKEKGLANHPKIRMMTVDKNATPEIQQDCSGKWIVASPETVGNFSASAWFFGRKLHKELDIPIGLINSSWGGTDVAAWTSGSAQEKNETLNQMMDKFDENAKRYDPEKAKQRFETALEKWNVTTKKRKAQGKKQTRKPRLQADPMVNQNRPSNLFNGMINPLVPYGIRGAIWYQGERNAKTIEGGQLYSDQLNMLITDWRTRWGIGDFPFITVQLPNFHKPTEKVVQNTGWVMVRESQLKTLRLKNTGIAITTDVGMADNIHPKNKQAVGQRLALWALGTTYEKDIVYSGPIFSYFEYSGPNNNKNGRCTVFMNHTADGLMASDGGKEIKGFIIAGSDQVFHPAKAYFNKKNGKLFVSSEEVESPIAVRYNWADNPNGNMVNSAGLPAAPFRTDDWKIEATKQARN